MFTFYFQKQLRHNDVRVAHACKWSGSRVEKLKLFSSRSRQNFKIHPGNISSVETFQEIHSHNDKVTIERR